MVVLPEDVHIGMIVRGSSSYNQDYTYEIVSQEDNTFFGTPVSDTAVKLWVVQGKPLDKPRRIDVERCVQAEDSFTTWVREVRAKNG